MDIQTTLNFIKNIPEFLEDYRQINTFTEDEFQKIMPIYHWHQLYEISFDELAALNSRLMNMEDDTKFIASSPDKLIATKNLMDRFNIEQVQEFDKSRAFTAYYPLLKSYISIIYNKKTLHDLVFQISTTKHPAELIKKALKIDKTIIHCSAVQQHIQRAELLNDSNLLKAVSIGLKSFVKEDSQTDFPELTLTLYELHRFNYLQKMSNDDLYQICVIDNNFWPNPHYLKEQESKGIEVDKDPESFRKQVKRTLQYLGIADSK